tara:strand:- start:360 stop:1622 length:1263 start_codon:yes stop_codon:yes gene_type:complete
MIFKSVLFILSFILLNTKICIPQEIDLIKIIAIVNDEPITATDLYERLQLTIVSSNLPNDPETRQNLSGQILQTLINEKLQQQEADRLNIIINENEINRTIRNIEINNNLNEGQLIETLSERGVPKNALKNNLKANLINEKLLQRIIKPKIIINNDEVNNEYKNLIMNEGKTEFKISEILLNFNDLSSKEETLLVAKELRNQIIKNNNFDEIANQININGTGKYIRNNEWLISTNLNEKLFDNLNKIQKNEITELIITNSSVSIYQLDDKRTNSIPDLSNSIVNLAFISFDLPINMNRINEVISKIKNQTTNISTCTEMYESTKEIGNKKGKILGRTSKNGLPNNFLIELENLDEKTPSKPIIADDGIYVLMICDFNKELNQEYALKEYVKNKLQNRSIVTLQNRYLLDLNRKALIDIRL